LHPLLWQTLTVHVPVDVVEVAAKVSVKVAGTGLGTGSDVEWSSVLEGFIQSMENVPRLPFPFVWVTTTFEQTVWLCTNELVGIVHVESSIVRVAR